MGKVPECRASCRCDGLNSYSYRSVSLILVTSLCARTFGGGYLVGECGAVRAGPTVTVTGTIVVENLPVVVRFKEP